MTLGDSLVTLSGEGDKLASPQTLPIADGLPEQALIIAAGYILTLAFSGLLVRAFTTPPEHLPSGEKGKIGFDPGAVIGKCENLLVLTFVLAGEVTGLALIFAAKSLVRKDQIATNASYYLGGTLVNFVWSVAMGYLIRLLAIGF